MSAFKLADTLLIPVEEAEQMILTYFSVFPNIKHFLEILGQYGVQNGFIRTFAPYRRIRWFSNWVPNMKKDKNLFKEMGKIERASKNTPKLYGPLYSDVYRNWMNCWKPKCSRA
jgi:DNA polymerase I-like protein with 3'-5' exonuclease and polymerase domains